MRRARRLNRPGLPGSSESAVLLSNDLQAEATLNLDFRSGVLDPRIDFQRTTTGTYYRGPFNQNLALQSEAFNTWTTNEASVLTDQTAAPNGTVTADKIVDNTVNAGHTATRIVLFVSGQQYTFSVYAKRGEVDFMFLRFYASGPWATNKIGIFDLLNGTAQSSLGSPAVSITDSGNGWYRCSITATADGATGNGTFGVLLSKTGTTSSYTGTGTEGIFVWGAQLTQGSLLTPYIPTTTAAITQGQIAAAEPWNLFTQSQDITNAGTYTLVGATSANITATAPDGSTTVTQLTESNLNERHLVGRTAYTALPIIDFPVTISVYLKKVSRRYIQLVGISSAASSFSAIFDLDTGTITDTRAQGGSYLGGTMVDVGGGWYRCTIFGFTSIAQTTLNVVHSNVATFGAGSLLAQSLQYLGDGTSQTLVWGEQLNYGSTALPYRSTTTAALWLPRFENDPITGAARGLLIEGGATNLCLQSAAVRTSPWTTQFLTTAGTSITAPDGTASGVELVPTNGTGSPNAFTYQVISASAATAYTTSVFLKAKGTTLNTVLRVWARSGGTLISTLLVTFNNANGTVGAVSSGTWTATSATSTHVGNGWYRVTLTGTTPATTDSVVPWILFDATGDGVNGVYAWGAQVEAQSFASSYIPTTTATVARGADSAVMTGTNFSSWYNQSAGTVLTSYQGLPSGVPSGSRAYEINDGTNNERITFITQGAASAATSLIVTDNTVAQASIALSGVNGLLPARIASAYAADNFGVSYNGNAAVTDTLGTVPTVNRLWILAGGTTGTQVANTCISRLAYWPTRLPDATLQALTT